MASPRRMPSLPQCPSSPPGGGGPRPGKSSPNTTTHRVKPQKSTPRSRPLALIRRCLLRGRISRLLAAALAAQLASIPYLLGEAKRRQRQHSASNDHFVDEDGRAPWLRDGDGGGADGGGTATAGKRGGGGGTLPFGFVMSELVDRVMPGDAPFDDDDEGRLFPRSKERRRTVLAAFPHADGEAGGPATRWDRGPAAAGGIGGGVARNVLRLARGRGYDARALATTGASGGPGADGGDPSPSLLDEWWSGRQLRGHFGRVGEEDVLLAVLDPVERRLDDGDDRGEDDDAGGRRVDDDVDGGGGIGIGIGIGIDSLVLSSPDFFANATIRYLVLGVRSRTELVTTTTTKTTANGTIVHTNSTTAMPSYEGIDAALTLLSNHYRVQILSISDYCKFDYEDDDDHQATCYGPNHMLKDEGEVREFFEWGWHAARRSTAAAAAAEGKGEGPADIEPPPPPLPEFRAYLFATRSLDLAIPSRRQHVDESGPAGYQLWQRIGKGGAAAVPYEKCPRRHDRVRLEFRRRLPAEVREEADRRRREDAGEFGAGMASAESLAKRRKKRRLLQSFRIYCDKSDVTQMIREKIKSLSYGENDDDVVEVWIDALADGDDDGDVEGDITSVAEAVCVRLRCDEFVKKGAPWNGDLKTKKDDAAGDNDDGAQVACVKRVVRRDDGEGAWHDAPPSILSRGGEKTPPRPPQPNLLLIEIGPMSRAQFARSLNETRFVLEEELRFARFDRHASLADGGIGPNLSALYSGGVDPPRDGGGDRDATTATAGRGGGDTWLWDRLRRAGYVTMGAEDVCPENSPSRGSGPVGRPDAATTDHGDSVTRMLCFDFDRPNCAGKDLAARHVLRYAEHFMRAYGGVGAGVTVRSGGGGKAKVPVNTKRPWAAFVSLVEGDEDGETLGSVVDRALAGFLRKNFAATPKKKKKGGSSTTAAAYSLGVDTVVVVTSNGGLCRGTYHQSPPGRRECHEPILYMSLGSSIGSKASSFSLRANLLLRGNAERKMWTTPLDVHETILHAVLGIKPRADRGGDDIGVDIGSSLIAVLPKTRTDCRTVPSIPREYCDLVERFDGGGQSRRSPLDGDGVGAAVDGDDGKGVVVAVSVPPVSTCTVSPPPPSILSFFADIPRDRRTKESPCRGGEDDIAASTDPKFRKTTSSCRCATSHRDWFPCKSHPWDFVVGPGRVDDDDVHDAGAAASAPAPFERETFVMVDCKGEDLKIETRILRRRSLVDRFNDKASSSPERPTSREGQDPHKRQRRWRQPPNILFLEIDSVSIAYADRHFPKTRALLRRYRPKEKEAAGGGGTATGTATVDVCPLGLCSVDYTNVALVGPNSIANQLGALGGCMATLFHETCLDHDEYYSNYDRCARGGQFTGTYTGTCIKCPPGQRLIDPTRRCESMQREPEVCCSSGGFPSRNPNHICSDVDALEYGLQLYQRGPRSLTTWCPPEPEGVDAATGSSSSPWMFDVAREEGYVTFFGEEFCYEGSPYVTQDNVMPTTADYHLHKLFCRLAVREAERLGRETKPNELWMIPIHDGLCVDGESSGVNKRKLAFEQISQIWEVYPDVPKFAFLNAIAAHDYGTDWSLMALGAESYDDHLSTFLESMLSRDDAHNTIIVIRSDHGLQGGNAIIDYSTQVEHQRPWTEIIVPHNFPGVSHEAMMGNRHALVSGYDIYRTLRSLVAPELRESEKKSQVSSSPPIPDWSYDLLSSRVPGDRTCREARVSPEFCPCDFQRREAPPGQLGICNQYEPYQIGFCSPQYDPALAKKK